MIVAATFGPASRDEVDGFRGRDMLEDDFELGEVADQRGQHAVDEHRLAVEHVDVRVGDLAVDAQHHADRLHPLERRWMLRMSVTPLR